MDLSGNGLCTMFGRTLEQSVQMYINESILGNFNGKFLIRDMQDQLLYF